MNEPIKLDPANKRHRAFKRLILGRRDIDAALTAVIYIIEEVKTLQDRMFDPLNCAAIICYSRPFIGRKQYPSLPQKYSEFPHDNLRLLHEDIIELRNTFVAHRDEKENVVKLIPKGVEITWADGKGKGTVISHGDYIHTRYLPLSSFSSFRTLCEFQLSRLKEHIAKETAALFP